VLARRSTLNHPIGAAIDLPCLVPSFSSKGFPFFKDTKTKKHHSETTCALEMMSPFIKNSILISAYDLHHGYFREPRQKLPGKELIIIDSGGYELSGDWDSTEPYQGSYKPEPFSEEEYIAIIKKLPKKLPFAIANCDWSKKGLSIEDQVLAAQDLFSAFPKFLHSFLVKPTGKQKYLDIADLIKHTGMFRRFHIIGVTEKELCKDILDRLINLAKLRSAMDRDQIGQPIHVWGGLDPIFTPLYFFAGAELFDGVSWLRYAYRNGVAIYRDCYGVLDKGIETPLDHVRTLTLNHNLTHLQELTTTLRRFVDEKGKSFSMFSWHAKEFEKAYKVLSTKVPELKRGV
jgi:hypothetical protein